MRLSRYWTALLCTILVALTFGLGALMVHARWYPYRWAISSPALAGLMAKIKGYDPASGPIERPAADMVLDELSVLRGIVFTHDLVAPTRQIDPPVRNLADLKARLESWLVDPAAIARYYESIELRSVSLGAPDLKSLGYRLETDRTAHAFFLPKGHDIAPCAILVIAGSGADEEWEMLYGNQENYQRNILPMARARCDTYLLIKRGESLLAVHDGRRKASGRAYYNYLINRGGSYSAMYLADGLAWVKHLRSSYARVAVVGLSQGGFAALLVAMFSEASDAVIASGYTAYLESTEYGGSDQIVVPGLQRFYSVDAVRRWLGKGKTRALFTYGIEERGGFYGLEAQNGPTCALLANLPNVECRGHAGAHVYWEPLVGPFLDGMTGARKN